MSSPPPLPPDLARILSGFGAQVTPPAPTPVTKLPTWLKWVAGAAGAVVLALGGAYTGHRLGTATPTNTDTSSTSTPTPPPPKKACGKCGSADCGCQTDAQIKSLQDAVDALKSAQPPKKTDVLDPFDASNSAPKNPAYTHVVDSSGRWWASANSDDADQRAWWSKDEGKTWWREGKPDLVSIPPTECKCPATGNKDGSQGPNNCRCHDMGLDCKCHKNAGIVYTTAPAGVQPVSPMASPALPVSPVAPRGMVRPMSMAGVARACST
jgi:hypothetical protein